MTGERDRERPRRVRLVAAVVAVGAAVGGLVGWMASTPSPPPPHPATRPVPAAADSPAPSPEAASPSVAASPTPTASPAPEREVWVDELPLGPVPTGDVAVPADPATVTQAYVRAVYEVTLEDATIRHRRHLPWLHPDAPARTGGVWTWDPPPAGVSRQVDVVSQQLYAGVTDEGQIRKVTFDLVDDGRLHDTRTVWVTLRRHDTVWLVMTETTAPPEPIAH